MEPGLLIAIILLLLWLTGVIAWTVLTLTDQRSPRRGQDTSGSSGHHSPQEDNGQ